MSKQVTFTDEMGRRTERFVPDSANEITYAFGAVIGPPDLSSLGLPEETMVRLHNQLHDRRILTPADFRRRRDEVFAALQAAYRVDVQTLETLYR